MSLKETIVLWNQGVDKALDGKFREALAIWTSMQEPGARILYNISSMHVLLGDLESAVKSLGEAVKKDPHLSLAYFQRGCLLLQLKRYSEAKSDMELSLKTLRGNPLIDYKQLGLQYKLYSCEVLYNYAYALHMLGDVGVAKEKLEVAKAQAGSTSESRHKTITAALDTIRLGTKFQSYQLPDKAKVFQPPRNKTEVLKPINFLGKAKVVSSVKDQDSYTGFVGVQEQRERQASPNPPRSKPAAPPSKPTPPPSLHIPGKVSKPDVPAPNPKFRIQSRISSLGLNSQQEVRPTKPQSGRPPKPTQAPPTLNVGGVHKPLGQTKSHEGLDGRNKKSLTPSSKMTVKIHYHMTRALRVSYSITYKQLQALICKKFELPDDSLTLFCKKKSGGDLREVTDEQTLKEVATNLDDGFRLTLWAYDKHETSPEAEMEEDEEVPVLMVCETTHAYTGQYEDELSFSVGQRVEITADSECSPAASWLYLVLLSHRVLFSDWVFLQCYFLTGCCVCFHTGVVFTLVLISYWLFHTGVTSYWCCFHTGVTSYLVSYWCCFHTGVAFALVLCSHWVLLSYLVWLHEKTSWHGTIIIMPLTLLRFFKTVI